MKNCFLICLSVMFLSEFAFAQEREIIPLNEHFYPLELGYGKHSYNVVKTVSEEGEIIEKIYTLKNQLVQQRKSRLNDGNIEYMQTSYYSTNGELQSIEVMEIEDDIQYTQVMTQDRMVLELACKGSVCSGEFTTAEGTIPVDRNVLKPSFTSMEMWINHLLNNLAYPIQSRRIGVQGNVLMGLRIGTNGKLLSLAVINPAIIHSTLQLEALSTAEEYMDGFVPALDLDGNPKEAWMFVPIKFKLH